MTVTLSPSLKKGSVSIPSSKSVMHRMLIVAALGSTETDISFDGLSNDIAATADCLNALGADISLKNDRLMHVVPISSVPEGLCHLHCRESGSTLRFMLPVVGLLGAEAVFHMEGRLPQRPMAPLDSILTEHGMTLRKDGSLLYCSGKLTPGAFSIPGNISSQYISGLLMALPGLSEASTIEITGKLESEAYITMTEDTLRMGNISYSKADSVYTVPGAQKAVFPAACSAEGDYSNAAFFLVVGALSPEGLLVKGLNPASSQGDKGVLDILARFGAEIAQRDDGIFIRGGKLRGITIDAAPVPDLIPVLSVAASVAEGSTVVENAGRLRLKESDRLQSTTDMLTRLGADITELPEGLIIKGKKLLAGGSVDSFGDHRIAMAAAVASCVCTGSVEINGSECTAKSYPRFWDDFAALEVIA